jgi:hypothetical protein
MNSAMDRVGLPAYGPDLTELVNDGDRQTLDRVVGALPSPLREVWRDALLASTDGAAVLNVDRRRVSVETKRLLERIPGLQFRQGFVVDLRVVETETGNRGAQVETVFGETFQADAVVVAVGLSLGAQTLAGTGATPGGRYGEPSSEGLEAALESLGATFEETLLEIGPRVATGSVPRGAHAAGALGQFRSPAGDLREERLEPLAAQAFGEPWPEDYPPAPHRDRSLRETWILMDTGQGEDGVPGPRTPVISPDGATTGELYIAPCTPATTAIQADSEEATGLMATRLDATVRALRVLDLTEDGRLTTSAGPSPVWLIGRCAGATDYRESLLSGIHAAEGLIGVLREKAS